MQERSLTGPWYSTWNGSCHVSNRNLACKDLQGLYFWRWLLVLNWFIVFLMLSSLCWWHRPVPRWGLMWIRVCHTRSRSLRRSCSPVAARIAHHRRSCLWEGGGVTCVREWIWSRLFTMLKMTQRTLAFFSLFQRLSETFKCKNCKNSESLNWCLWYLRKVLRICTCDEIYTARP